MIELVWLATRGEDRFTANIFQTKLREFEVANKLRYEIAPVDPKRGHKPSDIIVDGRLPLVQVLRELGLLEGQVLWCEAKVAREGGQVLYSWSLETAFGPQSRKGINGLMLSYSTEGTARIELKGKLQETDPNVVRAYGLLGEISENNFSNATGMRIFRGLFINAADWTHVALRHGKLLYQQQNPHVALRRF